MITNLTDISPFLQQEGLPEPCQISLFYDRRLQDNGYRFLCAGASLYWRARSGPRVEILEATFSSYDRPPCPTYFGCVEKPGRNPSGYVRMEGTFLEKVDFRRKLREVLPCHSTLFEAVGPFPNPRASISDLHSLLA